MYFMRVDIVSAGPSASNYETTAGVTVLAVNAAAGIVHADYWVFGDYATYSRIQPLGKPLVVTWGNALRKLPDATEPTYSRLPRHLRQIAYSLLGAISFAADDLQADLIAVYGDDKTGTGEAGQGDYPANRSAERWRLERQYQSMLESYYGLEPQAGDLLEQTTGASYVYKLFQRNSV